MWKVQKDWMTPKADGCINCGGTVDKYGAGYIVWDSGTGKFWRQHAECHVDEDLRIQHIIDASAA